MKQAAILLALLLCSCGAPEMVKEQWGRYEQIERDELTDEAAMRDAVEALFDLVEEAGDALRPSSPEAVESKAVWLQSVADSKAIVLRNHAGKDKVAVEKLELMRGFGKFLLWPGLFGDSDSVARWDERALMLIREAKK